MNRWLHRCGVALAIAAGTGTGTGLSVGPLAQAAEPQVKASAPGFYRMMLGDFEVTALSDGMLTLPVDKLLTNTKPGQVERALSKAGLTSPVEASVNAYLINTGAKRVLVDAGGAALFGPAAGHLVDNLKAAGYQPEQVDAVLITHAHPDHAGGLTVGGKAAFPNATLHIDQRELDAWLSPVTLANAPAEAKEFLRGAPAALNPYRAAGKLMPFSGDTELMPGIKAHAAAGHTPGHSTYSVESKGQKLVLWGDLMHVAAVQFADPSVNFLFDADSKQAARARRQAYAEAAKQGCWVAAAHLSFPGIGHLRSEGRGYVFEPANGSVVR